CILSVPALPDAPLGAGTRSIARACQDRVNAVRSQVLLESMVQLHRRRATTRPQALHRAGPGELAVGRGGAGLAAQRPRKVVDDAVRAAQRARHVDTHEHFVTAMGPLEVHGVKGGDRLDLARRHLEQPRHLGHPVRCEVADLVLHGPQGGEDRALRPRVAAAGPLDLGPRLGTECHRSTSPSRMSMEPMTATTSAMSSPCTMCGRALRLLNDGARTLTRYGRLLPSLTM